MSLEKLREELARCRERESQFQEEMKRVKDELDQWDTFKQTDIYQQFTDVRAKLAQVTQERDAVLAEAVWAMEYVKDVQQLSTHPDYQRATTFLASPLVAQWRERQEQKS